MQLCVLGSGSTGNCIYVASGTHRILIDAGLSGREIERRLGVIGVPLETIQAVCVTHEHDDHISALGLLQRRYGAALYANSATIDGVSRGSKEKDLKWNVFSTGYRFAIGDLSLEPFSVSHDAMDPVGFVVCSGDQRLAVATDIGTATAMVRQKFRACHAIVIESNHDVDLLHGSERPWAIKQRIKGRQGHFSNAQAAELVAEAADERLQAVFLAHLSLECNVPAKAVKVMRAALDGRGLVSVAVELTYADQPSRLWTSGSA